MKNYAKKALAVLMAAIMLMSTAAVIGFAADGKCDCEHCPSIVIPGIFQSKVRYLDENGNEIDGDFILAILELYKNKTELKGVAGKEAEYMVSKGMLNACYGMAVTDIVREVNEYTDRWELPYVPLIDNEIKKYNRKRGRFLYYPWGLFVTAYARRNLFTGILEAGINDYIYSDTDSIKMLNTEKHMDYFRRYNEQIIDKLTYALEYQDIDPDYIRPKTIKGIEKPLGVWDYEGTFDRFRALGAKRYLLEENGNLELTVSGLNKKIAVPY